MINLIGLGFEKCGTTSLVSLLEKHPSFLIPKRKETYFFFPHLFKNGLEYYHSWYDFPSKPSALYMVDFTPSYSRHVKVILNNIRTVCSDDTRYIICMRHQIERAYSNYIHDIALKHGPWRGPIYKNRTLFDKPYDLSFIDEEEQNYTNHFTTYYDTLSHIIHSVGRDRVLILILEEDFKSDFILSDALSAFLERDIKIEQVEILKKNINIFPYYFYNSDRNKILYHRTMPVETEAGTLYFVSKAGIFDFPDLPEDKRHEIIEKSTNWTRFIPASWIKEQYDTMFEEDTRKLEDLLRRDLSCWRRHRDLGY